MGVCAVDGLGNATVYIQQHFSGCAPFWWFSTGATKTKRARVLLVVWAFLIVPLIISAPFTLLNQLKLTRQRLY